MSVKISDKYQVVRYATSALPIHLAAAHDVQYSANLTLVVYRETDSAGKALPGPEVAGITSDPKEHVAIIAGKLEALSGEDVLCRVHSECWTGETLGSLKCDCREQLDLALAAINAAGRGVIVYLRQEGRGIGLGNKIRAYALQDGGADTVEANEQLGFAIDLRGYELAASILSDLGCKSVALMTNNPDKVTGLERAGVVVRERISHWGTSNAFNEDYLDVKKSKLGHKA